jgi:hypothetical protein
MNTDPDFKLEIWFSKWEFAARHHVTASDAQSMTLSELLALASAEDRQAYESAWLGYTQTWGAPDLREVDVRSDRSRAGALFRRRGGGFVRTHALSARAAGSRDRDYAELLISVNFPRNPTGKILEHERFAQLVEI